METVERRETVRDGVRPREFRSAERAGGRSEARRFIGRRLLWNRGNGGVGPAGGGENAVPSFLCGGEGVDLGREWGWREDVRCRDERCNEGDEEKCGNRGVDSAVGRCDPFELFDE